MAGATFFLFQPPITTAHGHKIQFKPLLITSKSIPQFPSKITRRKNHLRPKILKTLIKPTSPQLTIQLPIQNDAVLDDQAFEKIDKVVEKFDEVEEFNVTESVVEKFDEVEDFSVTESGSDPIEYSGKIGKFPVKSVLKFCGFFIGVFLFQTVVAIWVFRNDESESKVRSFDSKGKVVLSGDVKLGSESGNVVYYDEEKLEERVGEIREMARKAREMEMRGRERSSESGIGKEIGAGLDRIGKRLNAKREKVPEKVMEFMGLFEGGNDEFSDDEEEEEEDSKEVEEKVANEEEIAHLRDEDRKLMFEKTNRFRGPSVKQRTKPKGFSGLKNQNGGQLGKERKNFRKEKKSGVGVVQGNREEKSSIEVMRSQNFNGSKSHGSVKSAEENQEMTTKSQAYASSGRNGSRKAESRPSINKTQPKNSESQTDAWWMKLPYVLAILMRRGPDNEAAGLFSLSRSSQSDEHEPSYTVLFEDRGDANNFCYLLDSFFEELGDFKADIVPMSTEEVKSESNNKVIAVKKGQLKLYAGQPMEEVETALRSLLEQNQSS